MKTSRIKNAIVSGVVKCGEALLAGTSFVIHKAKRDKKDVSGPVEQVKPDVKTVVPVRTLDYLDRLIKIVPIIKKDELP